MDIAWLIMAVIIGGIAIMLAWYGIDWIIRRYGERKDGRAE